MIALKKRLGKGSYGSVYKGVLRKDRQVIDVAVKVLSDMSPENSLALWREARVMQMYDHPHLVADFGLTRKSKSYKVNPDKPMNLRWLAPDVYHTGIVEKHTDVYAFGITMWEVFEIPYHIPYHKWDADEVTKY
ncbi:unnamed protein product [Angiostrongylus costaricensis]|uniref:Protein kinase domain-containing protein n=1 Tax=Angiostrongylus costaricensis TaxID=334426 RepID=A0A0R3PQT6_ANGCS|nr:unnamed protein product [Angiostrongylus costaricensis]